MINQAKTLLNMSYNQESGMAERSIARAAVFAQLAVATELYRLRELLALHLGYANVAEDTEPPTPIEYVEDDDPDPIAF